MEVWEEWDYIPIATHVTIRMIPALRWTAMRCFINRDGQSYKTVSTNHNLFEEKGEPKQNRAEALLLTSLTPQSSAGVG